LIIATCGLQDTEGARDQRTVGGRWEPTIKTSMIELLVNDQSCTNEADSAICRNFDHCHFDH
jgi:hypothetical protein